MKNAYWYILSIIVIIAIVKQCEKETKTIINTKIEYVKVTDTITKTEIKEVPKIVYVQKYRDSIVYVDKPNDTTIKANQYDTKLITDNATANLKITTTGELLDVFGTIDYTKETVTETIIKTRNNSGLFLYGQTSINPVFERVAIGLDYQIRNTIIIGGYVDYDNVSQSVGTGVKVGFRIF